MNRAAIVGAGPVRVLRRRPAAEGRLRRRPATTRCRRRTGWCARASRPTTRRSSRSSGCTPRRRRTSRFASSAACRWASTSRRQELLERYHAVIYAVGTSTDNRLGIPGEDRPGSHAATDFVAWYNGHPDYADHDVRPQRRARGGGRQRQRRDRRGADAGAATPRSWRRPTPPTTRSRRFGMAGGHARSSCWAAAARPQAAFTNPELRELGELERADVIVDPAQLEGVAVARGRRRDQAAQRRDPARLRRSATPSGKSHRLELRFLRSPVEILGEGDDGPVTGVRVAINRLGRRRGRPRARRADRRDRGHRVRAGAALDRLPRHAARGIPFDERRGLIRNEGGPRGRRRGVCRGEYVVGWIKRGPTGVIGTNKKDAADTVARILEDADSGALGAPDPALGRRRDRGLADRARPRPRHLGRAGR